MSNRMGRSKHKIETGKEPCMRCGEPLTNEFRKQPWCFECGIELQAMEFDGEEVLEMMMSVMPPQHLRVVMVSQMNSIVTRMLVHKGVLPDCGDNNNDDEGGAPVPSKILVP